MHARHDNMVIFTQLHCWINSFKPGRFFIYIVVPPQLTNRDKLQEYKNKDNNLNNIHIHNWARHTFKHEIRILDKTYRICIGKLPIETSIACRWRPAIARAEDVGCDFQEKI